MARRTVNTYYAVGKGKKGGKKSSGKATSYKYDRYKQKEKRRAFYWYVIIACQIALLAYLIAKDKDKIFGTDELLTIEQSDVADNKPAKAVKVKKEKPNQSVNKKFIPEEELDKGVNETLPIVNKKPVDDKAGKISEAVSTPVKNDTIKPLTDKNTVGKKQSKITPLWKQNAVKTSKLPKNKAFVAVIIDDMGVDKLHTKDILDIPAPLTVSFITYASDLEKWADNARKNGKEIMLHIPMQPSNPKVDSGPDTLVVGMGKKDVDDVLRRTVLPLIKSLKPAGANNHMGSKFTSSKEGMDYFMRDFVKTGLYFVDSVTAAETVALKTADEFGVPAAPRNVFLDNTDRVDYVAGQLALLEEAAKKQGFAIGIGHPHTSTVQALRDWVNTLDEKGLCLVPASVIIEKRAEMSEIKGMNNK